MCSIWDEYAKDNRSRMQARIDGTLYIIRNETGRTRLDEDHKLYQHYIQFRNGRSAYSTNLSCVGQIPTYFKKRLPDNAVFVRSWDKEKE